MTVRYAQPLQSAGYPDAVEIFGYVWDTDELDWVKAQQPLLEAGSVTIPGSVAVTGTFWQTTQPVSLASAVDTLSGLAIPEHDYISLSYTGANLTGVVFKTGGAGGTTVATLTLAYSGSDLTSVTKS